MNKKNAPNDWCYVNNLKDPRKPIAIELPSGHAVGFKNDIDVKVALIGERLLYYLLYHYDPDFRELFKVVADFEESIVRSEENTYL